MKQFIGTIFYCLTLSWRSSKLYTILRLLGKVILPITGIISAYLIKQIIDVLSKAVAVNSPQILIMYLVAGTALLALITAITRRLINYAESLHYDILDKQIRIDIMEKSLSADLELFDNPQYYNKLTSVYRDSYAVTSVLWCVLDCISSMITFASAFVILCSSNPLYGILMVIAALPSAIAGQKYTKIIYQLGLTQLNAERQKSYVSNIASDKNYAQEVRLFGIGTMLKDRYSSIWQQIYAAKKNKIQKQAIWITFFSFLPEAIIVYATLDISMQVLNGNATIGDYSLYTALLTQIGTAIIMMVSSITQVYENKLKIDNVKSFEDIGGRVPDCGEINLSEVKSISFDHVSFAYPKARENVLTDVTFTLQGGEKIALVGINGSGKTTLIKLLLRFYDVTSGEIKINGENIKNYTLESLRSNFSCYFQNAINYGFTLRENITLADFQRNGTDENITDALEKSGAASFFEQLPHGLNTYITRLFDEDGAELSVGQNQKLALARAFYRSSSSLILDEPSSSLDPEAEDRLFKSLLQLCKNKTTIFTSHRLSNITLADRIIVIENGKILEIGTKEELLKNPQRFSQLYHYQADKYKLNEDVV